MRPSLIQLVDLVYFGISVTPRDSEDFEGEDASKFDFDGVYIGENSNIRVIDNSDDSTTFAVHLNIRITNEKGKKAPYNIDIMSAGLFKIPANINIPKEKHEEVVLANGCAVLYGSIRDQVMTLTARGIHGRLMLPTANFSDKINRPIQTVEPSTSSEDNHSSFEKADQPKRNRKTRTGKLQSKV